MDRQKTIFITGATGFVGCHLAHAQLLAGHRVAVLVRDDGRNGARRRAEAAIAAVDDGDPVSFDNLVVIPGDVRESAKVLLEKAHTYLDGPIDEVWHCVATFKFTEKEKPEIIATNIEGVRHMLDFVLGVNKGEKRPRYFHVSTAYSSGREHAIVPEAFVRHNNDFRSLYEWSKHEGEALVHQYQQEHGMDATIFRPSIIVGAPTTKVISHSAYYQVIGALWRLRKRFERKSNGTYDGSFPIRLMGVPQNRVNFVPIDYVTNAMLLVSQVPELETTELKTFNIVNENPILIEMLQKVASESLEIHGLRMVTAEAFEAEPMTSLERVLARGISFQAPYMMEEIHFSTQAFRQYVSHEELPPLQIDEAFLEAINAIFFASLEEAWQANQQPEVG